MYCEEGDVACTPSDGKKDYGSLKTEEGVTYWEYDTIIDPDAVTLCEKEGYDPECFNFYCDSGEISCSTKNNNQLCTPTSGGDRACNICSEKNCVPSNEGSSCSGTCSACNLGECVTNVPTNVCKIINGCQILCGEDGACKDTTHAGDTCNKYNSNCWTGTCAIDYHPDHDALYCTNTPKFGDEQQCCPNDNPLIKTDIICPLPSPCCKQPKGEQYFCNNCGAG